MAVIALVAALGGAIAAVMKLFPTRKSPQNIHEITEIVVDGSEHMGDKGFEGGTRLEAAAESARVVLESVADSDVLGLRRFGGPCDGDNTRIVVKPAQENKRKMQKSLGSLKAEGQASLGGYSDELWWSLVRATRALMGIPLRPSDLGWSVSKAPTFTWISTS